MVLLYTCSTIYHSLRVNLAKRVFRVLDHCGVYLLIAGTYTPLMLVSMYGQSQVTAVVMLVVIWAAAAVGIVFSSISLRRFRVLSAICYMAMGWSVIFTFSPMMRALGQVRYKAARLGRCGVYTGRGFVRDRFKEALFSFGVPLLRAGRQRAALPVYLPLCALMDKKTERGNFSYECRAL